MNPAEYLYHQQESKIDLNVGFLKAPPDLQFQPHLQTLTSIYSSRLATVAAINGACPAGGCALAMCCATGLWNQLFGLGMECPSGCWGDMVAMEVMNTLKRVERNKICIIHLWEDFFWLSYCWSTKNWWETKAVDLVQWVEPETTWSL